jgi:hypothetical protein
MVLISLLYESNRAYLTANNNLYDTIKKKLNKQSERIKALMMKERKKEKKKMPLFSCLAV